MRAGRTLLVLSILTRTGVIAILCFLAMLTSYHNLKRSYNSPRLVELSEGKGMRVFYEKTDAFFSAFGDPAREAQKSGEMTWSIRLGGVPFTDPVAALSVLAKSHRWETGFALGLIIPLTLSLLFGRIFCAYVCPASLLFFAISRVRTLLAKFFWLPEWSLNRGFCWGILVGGLATAIWIGHGVWTFILPYFALGQTLFHGIAYGALSFSLGSIVVFSLLDLIMGKQFTCRYICPTGRLLGAVGRKSVFALKRDADDCVEACTSCIDVCPMAVSPKYDETLDCSMCGECLTICPTKCLSIGLRKTAPAKPDSPLMIRRNILPVVLSCLVLGVAGVVSAHHFKGLPHYNYFENYPQVPEEEFIGEVGDYEVSLVVYDFQGINRDKVDDPDMVRMFLMIFNLRDHGVYGGPLTLEVLDRDKVVHTERFEKAELENLYSIHQDLPDTGKYSLRMTLHGEGDLQCTIPFGLSSQKVNWTWWVGGGLGVLILVGAVGARRARVKQDRIEARKGS